MPKFELSDEPVHQMVEGYYVVTQYKFKYSKEYQRISETLEPLGEIPGKMYEAFYIKWEVVVLGYYITRGIQYAYKMHRTRGRLSDLDMEAVLDPSAIPDKKVRQKMEEAVNRACLKRPKEAKRYREIQRWNEREMLHEKWYAFLYGYLWMTKMLPYVEPYQDKENIDWIYEQLT